MDIFERQRHWEEGKRKKLENMKQKQERDELEDCTFAPRVNDESQTGLSDISTVIEKTLINCEAIDKFLQR